MTRDRRHTAAAVLWAVTWLTVVWVTLWRSATLGTLLSGAALALAVVALVGRPTVRGRTTIRPLATVRFLTRFAGDLVTASATVAWDVITPRRHGVPGIVAVPVSCSSDAVTMILANAISLVPGTVTIDSCDTPLTLFVHVLHLRDPDQVRADVHALEQRIEAAFGSPAMPTGRRPTVDVPIGGPT